MSDLVLVDPTEPGRVRVPSYYPVQGLIDSWTRLGWSTRKRHVMTGRILKRYPSLALPSRGGRPRELVPLMGPRTDWLDLRSRTGRPVLLCWDVWPSNASRWEALFALVRPTTLLMTARESARHWSGQLEIPVLWLPEATDTASYDPSVPLSQRRIDVLEPGRRDQDFHDAVAGRLRADNRRHMFQLGPSQVLFPLREQLIAAMADSRMVICFPSSRTHPARSGSVETMTHRYLEAMASGALPVGLAPREMVDFFGHDPVVRVEAGREYEAVSKILDDPDAYQDLADRNLDAVRRLASWDTRVTQLRDALALADG